MPLLLLLPSGLWANYSAETSVRFGPVDTGPSVKYVASPEVAFFRGIDDGDVQAIGVSYVGYHWTDATTVLISPPAGSTDVINRVDTKGRVSWTTLFVNYRYTLTLSPQLSVYLCPKLGAGRAQGSGTETSFGSIAGPVTRNYSFKTPWKAAAEINMGANLTLNKQWSARLGGCITAIDGESRPLSKALKSFQGVAGLNFSF